MRSTASRPWFVLGAALCLVLSAGSASAQVCDFYDIVETTGTPVAGTDDILSNCDDCMVAVPLPFPVQFYNSVYNAVNVDSNGNVQFDSNTSVFGNSCLPETSFFGATILAHWDDLRTDQSGADGIFTATTGVAPNRTFIIEWRTPYFAGGGSANFSVILHEDTANFEVIYGTIDQGGAGATIGVQDGVASFSEYSCDLPGSAITGRQLNFICGENVSVLEIPTLSATGLTALVAALAAFGIVAMRRRRSA